MNSYNLSFIRDLPKSDLHSHAGRGGRIKYIEHWAGIKITPNDKPFESLSEMQSWFENHVKCHCSGIDGYLKRIEAAFVQAADDHIKVLTLSYGIGEIDSLGGMIPFIRTMEDFHANFAPDTLFFPELSLGREQDVDYLASRLDEIFSYNWFKSIDICNNEFAQPIRNFKKIYRRARSAGLKLRAHVGEFGSADDIWEAVENLELDEVHHGIAAARSDKVMRFLSDNKIRLNICPTSNVMLKTAKSYAAHPIRILYDHGIPVTINTDDLLIFNRSVSEEYMNLYRSKLMTADELEDIRLTGLEYRQ
ncbi:MAG: adenosine deaminase [Clostridiaceae bacterium]|nr:adenosine deaminase [Clostridiaceae bacterium]